MLQIVKGIQNPKTSPRHLNFNTVTVANIPHMHITIRSLGIAFCPRGGHRKRKILMDSHPYSYETSIFTLGAPHEVQGRQTKHHPGLTLGKLVQPSPEISIIRDSTLFFPNSLNDVLKNFLIDIGQWT